ncbi:MAG: thiolase family protein [Rhodobacteraceae bacterium]|nr:thiolase family protein [Paracoccaceae bacterium]
MKNIVIVDSVRTGLAKSFRGTFNMTRGDDMITHLIDAMLDRNPNLPADAVEDVIMGCGNPEGATGHNIGRNAVVLSKLPLTVGGTTVNRYCSSGLQTISMAAGQIMAGCYDTVIAGGVESISMVQPKMNLDNFVNPKINENNPGIYFPMGTTAEVVAKRYNVSRESQDEYSLQSQLRTAEAQEAGRYDDEIIPMKTQMLLTNKETGEQKVVDAECVKDECNRPTTTLEGLAGLKPVFDENGSVTAGNSSGINDGTASLILANKDALKTHKAVALARIVAYGFGGVPPRIMGMGPVPASKMALQRAGLTIDDLDLIESNEAFAAQACAVSRELGFDPARVNPNGGAIALGHPVGATGAIIMTKLVHELHRINGRYGMATMCIGGGQGISVIIDAKP